MHSKGGQKVDPWYLADSSRTVRYFFALPPPRRGPLFPVGEKKLPVVSRRRGRDALQGRTESGPLVFGGPVLTGPLFFCPPQARRFVPWGR